MSDRRLCAAVRVEATERSFQPLVVLECDGVVVDLHTDGHRISFNSAFRVGSDYNAGVTV